MVVILEMQVGEFTEIGQDVPPRDQQTSEGLAAYRKSEIETWWPIVRSAHISIE